MAKCLKILMWSINLITAWMLIAFSIVEIHIFPFTLSPVLGIIANICLALSPFTDTIMVFSWIVIYSLSATASGILLALKMEPLSIIYSRTMDRVIGGLIGLQRPSYIIPIIMIIITLMFVLDIESRCKNIEPILPLHQCPASHGDQNLKNKSTNIRKKNPNQLLNSTAQNVSIKPLSKP
jgi:hypothetical protein